MAKLLGHTIIEKNGKLIEVRVYKSERPPRKGYVDVDVKKEVLCIYDDWGIGAT